MPSPMTKDASRDPEIRSLDDFLENPQITRITEDSEYNGCST
jgi:hypothetical protein